MLAVINVSSRRQAANRRGFGSSRAGGLWGSSRSPSYSRSRSSSSPSYSRSRSSSSPSRSRSSRLPAPPPALSRCSWWSSSRDFRGAYLPCDELEKARRFNSQTMRGFLDKNYKTIRDQMNRAGLLHSAKGQWEVGHACPNEPGSERDSVEWKIKGEICSLRLIATTCDTPSPMDVATAKCRAKRPHFTPRGTCPATQLALMARIAAFTSKRVVGRSSPK